MEQQCMLDQFVVHGEACCQAYAHIHTQQTGEVDGGGAEDVCKVVWLLSRTPLYRHPYTHTVHRLC